MLGYRVHAKNLAVLGWISYSLYIFSSFPIYCLYKMIIKNVIQGDKYAKLYRDNVHQASCSSLQLCGVGSPERNDSSPHLAASTNNPVGGRHLAKLLRVKEGNPWWGEGGEDGRGEEWRRHCWRGGQAMTMWERLGGWGVGHGWETPQRKMIGTARWSSLSRATLLLLLLLHVLLDVLPLQQWGCRLFLQPHLLLPGIGEQMGQRQAFLLGEHQLEPKQSPHSAPFSASAPPPWCLGAGILSCDILSCDISDLIKYCEGNIYQQ